MTEEPRIPSTDDERALSLAAVEHLFVGMTNSAALAEDGGPPIFVKGEGARVTDIRGKSYIDVVAGFSFRNVGFGRTEIADAVRDQLVAFNMHVGGGSAPSTIQLAAKMAAITPGTLTKTFFTSGGSESTETALKMAKGYHNRRGDKGRYKVISRKNSFHGYTNFTQWLGGHPFLPRNEYNPMPIGIVHAPDPNPYRCELGGRTPEECAEKCANAIEELIVFHDPDSVSAVIGEPVAQPLGGVVPGPGYWERVREICDRYGVLLVFDEIITGFGRLGTMFGSERFDVVPDIMAFAKGVTSGYFPMGGAIATKKVADYFTGGPEATFKHMFTYTGHPAGAAAALVNIDIIEREKLVENSRLRGEQLRERLLDIEDRHPSVGEARGIGLLQGLELVKDRETKELWPPEARFPERMTARLFDRGIYLRVRGQILQMTPPLVITADEIDEIATAIDEAFTETERELGVR